MGRSTKVREERAPKESEPTVNDAFDVRGLIWTLDMPGGYCICCLSVPLEMSPERIPLVSRDRKPGYSHKPPTVDLWGGFIIMFSQSDNLEASQGHKKIQRCLVARPQHTG